MMKSIGNWTLWLIVNGCFAFTLYLGSGVGGVEFEGMQNVAIFLCWLLFAISLVMWWGYLEGIIKYIRDDGVPIWLDRLFDWGVIIFLVFTGWFITAIAYLIHRLIHDMIAGKENSTKTKGETR